MDPILDTYKKKIIENPIADEILEMTAKANIDRLDFGLKKITKDHSHVVFENETKYQNYKPEPNSKPKYYSVASYFSMVIRLGSAGFNLFLLQELVKELTIDFN